MRRKVMKDALMDASKKGDIDALYDILKKVPEILEHINKVQFIHTPLHVAVEADQTYFAIELMNLMPSFARKLNPQGLSPLHLAVVECTIEPVQDEERRNEIAKALIKLDPELIRVKGRQRMTPLHYAVIKNNLDLLAYFLCACPGSIDDLTKEFQTAVHIAVKEKKKDALAVLLGWLSRRNREDVLDFKDAKGNTALHVAVETEQSEVVEKLIHKVKRNSFNSEKSTAFDIAEKKKNTKIKNYLKREGGRPAKLILLGNIETLPEFLKSKENFAERVFRLMLYMGKELSLDMRNIILVVAVLIVTATFQGVLQPPGGFWQGNKVQTTQIVHRMDPVRMRDMYNFRKQHVDKQLPGKVVMGSHNFNSFMIGNTIAFAFAAMVIFMVLPGRPYLLGLHASMMFLAFSYLKAIQIIAEQTNTTQSLIIITWLVISVAFVARLQYFIAKALFYEAWWLPRLSVLATNSLYQIPLKKWVEFIVRFNYRLKLQHKVSRLAEGRHE